MYRSASRHFPKNLLILIIEYSRENTAVSVTETVRYYKINISIARYYNFNGWNCEPPFFADYILFIPIFYLDPRDNSLLAFSPAAGRREQG